MLGSGLVGWESSGGERDKGTLDLSKEAPYDITLFDNEHCMLIIFYLEFRTYIIGKTFSECS